MKNYLITKGEFGFILYLKNKIDSFRIRGKAFKFIRDQLMISKERKIFVDLSLTETYEIHYPIENIYKEYFYSLMSKLSTKGISAEQFRQIENQLELAKQELSEDTKEKLTLAIQKDSSCKYLLSQVNLLFPIKNSPEDMIHKIKLIRIIQGIKSEIINQIKITESAHDLETLQKDLDGIRNLLYSELTTAEPLSKIYKNTFN